MLAEINGLTLELLTDRTVFSPNCIDKGTLAMLSQVNFEESDKVLDLGCGYGAVGIYAARLIGADKVFMCDVDPLAVRLARQNAMLNQVPEVRIIESDGFKNLTDTGFTKILSNPPYHADFSVPKHFIEKGFNRLALGGQIVMVTKRKDWYKNKLIAIFGGVSIREIDGYFVFIAEKRSVNYAK